tara:strand:+ start:510 stop:1229 length:720 start_codon:yes stop_codon:yes gene_type:complete
MNLVLDLGNTNVKWAVLDKDKIIDYKIICDFSIDELIQIRLKYPSINNICCAHSGIFRQSIKKFCKEFKIKYLAVNHSCNLPIKIYYDTPKTLGADRIALCVGAHMTNPGNKLIIDIGTCITYDLLIQNKYIGGQISPGVYMRLNSLYRDTANLPKLNFDIISQDIGKTTKDSILIGVYEGILFEIEGIIQKHKLRYPDMKVFLTGGDSNLFKKRIKHINFINPYLLMEGLNYIIAFNE